MPSRISVSVCTPAVDEPMKKHDEPAACFSKMDVVGTAALMYMGNYMEIDIATILQEPQVPLDLPYLGQSTTSSSRLHQADRPSGSLRAQPTFSNPIVSAGSVHPIICTFAREEGVELIGCGTRSQKGANALRETAVVLPSLALSGQQFVPALSMRPIDEPAQTMDESASPDSEGSLKPLARHESGQNVKGKPTIS